MNLVTLLINSSAGLIVFILLGLIVRKVYHRHVTWPHRQEVRALKTLLEVEELNCEARNRIIDSYAGEVLRLRRQMKIVQEAVEHRQGIIKGLKDEEGRLRCNISQMASRMNQLQQSRDAWRKTAQSLERERMDLKLQLALLNAGGPK